MVYRGVRFDAIVYPYSCIMILSPADILLSQEVMTEVLERAAQEAIEQQQKTIEQAKKIMKKTTFDLEQDIMASWQTANDIELAYNYIGDDPFFQGIDGKHADKIANIMMGLHELHELRMNELWNTFESLIKQNAFSGQQAIPTVDGMYPVDFDRVEVISPIGREYVRQKDISVHTISVQDNGKTLKVFYEED